VRVRAINNAESTDMFDRTGKYRLVNVRAASYWRFREALDPVHGDNIALPDDSELRADLTAPRFKVTAQGIVVEPKHGSGSISERLGRSPDCGDAVVLAAFIEDQLEGYVSLPATRAPHNAMAAILALHSNGNGGRDTQ
jgi:hypothetical protein